MTQEEKAKAYDEALERAKRMFSEKEVNFLFPELKESEDERVRKDLINTIKLAYDCGVAITIETRDKYLAWLEKQGEQKPVDKVESKQEWSEEDEIFVNGLIRGLSAKRDIHGHTTFSSDCIDITETINWLESLKDRALQQPKQEWSKEDEKCLRLSTDIIDSALRAGFCVQLDRDRCVDWLKSLRPQNRWEPSDE